MAKITSAPGLDVAAAVELRHCIRRVEELASAWHRADPHSISAPRIAWLATEAAAELAKEVRTTSPRAAELPARGGQGGLWE